MKKNLISILILALLVVNVVLTAIMMFSVTSTAKKTSSLVTNIASVLNIELTSKEEAKEKTVSITDSVPFDIADQLTIPLRRSSDTPEEKTHYCLVQVSFYMDSTHEDYEAYKDTVATNISMLKNIIIDVISSHTLEEASGNAEGLKAEILSQVQTLYGSTFIYKVAFSNIMYQ